MALNMWQYFCSNNARASENVGIHQELFSKEGGELKHNICQVTLKVCWRNNPGLERELSSSCACYMAVKTCV